MPFSNSSTRIYSSTDVERVNPNQLGVYGLFNESRWIFIGSGDIRDRMLSHLRGDNKADPCIALQKPTGWMAEVVSNYREREAALYRELQPACGERAG